MSPMGVHPANYSRRRFLGLSMGAAASATLAACGGADSSSAKGDLETSELTAGTLAPGSGSSQLALGIQEGIFSEHGLSVEESFAAGGAALVPALVSGRYDFIWGNYIPYLQAMEQGMELRLVAGASRMQEGVHGLLVKSNSSIESPADFAGRVLAVNTLGNIGEIAYKEALEGAGVDPSRVTFTEIGFPEMAGALDRGSIDVAWLPANFRAAAEASPKFRLVLDFADVQSIEGLPNGGFVTTDSWVSTNPNSLQALQAALKQATEYANSHEQQVRQLYVDRAELPKDLAQKMPLEELNTEVALKDVQRMMQLMVKWNLLNTRFDLRDFYSALN